MKNKLKYFLFALVATVLFSMPVFADGELIKSKDGYKVEYEIEEYPELFQVDIYLNKSTGGMDDAYFLIRFDTYSGRASDRKHLINGKYKHNKEVEEAGKITPFEKGIEDDRMQVKLTQLEDGRYYLFSQSFNKEAVRDFQIHFDYAVTDSGYSGDLPNDPYEILFGGVDYISEEVKFDKIDRKFPYFNKAWHERAKKAFAKSGVPGEYKDSDYVAHTKKVIDVHRDGAIPSRHKRIHLYYTDQQIRDKQLDLASIPVLHEFDENGNEIIKDEPKEEPKQEDKVEENAPEQKEEVNYLPYIFGGVSLIGIILVLIVLKRRAI